MVMRVCSVRGHARTIVLAELEVGEVVGVGVGATWASLIGRGGPLRGRDWSTWRPLIGRGGVAAQLVLLAAGALLRRMQARNGKQTTKQASTQARKHATKQLGRV